MKNACAAALAAVLACAAVRADDAKPKSAPTTRESIMTFLKHLKQALTESSVAEQYKSGATGATVAAVRGENQNSALADPNAPILKGGADEALAKRRKAEDAEFEKGVDLLLAGKTAEGVKALEAFKAKHPKYRDLADVQKAIDGAKKLGANATSGDSKKASAN